MEVYGGKTHKLSLVSASTCQSPTSHLIDAHFPPKRTPPAITMIHWFQTPTRVISRMFRHWPYLVSNPISCDVPIISKHTYLCHFFCCPRHDSWLSSIHLKSFSILSLDHSLEVFASNFCVAWLTVRWIWSVGWRQVASIISYVNWRLKVS